jgi:hypothetical protein
MTEYIVKKVVEKVIVGVFTNNGVVSLAGVAGRS